MAQNSLRKLDGKRQSNHSIKGCIYRGQYGFNQGNRKRSIEKQRVARQRRQLAEPGSYHRALRCYGKSQPIIICFTPAHSSGRLMQWPTALRGSWSRHGRRLPSQPRRNLKTWRCVYVCLEDGYKDVRRGNQWSQWCQSIIGCKTQVKHQA